MSSSPAPSQVDLAGFKLVSEVLRAARRWGSQSDASSDMKRSTPSTRFDQLPAGSAVDRWQDEGGR
jgi:hypothetical protein